MRSSRRRFLGLTLSAGTSLALPALLPRGLGPLAAGPTPDARRQALLADLERLVAELKAKAGVPGVSIAVIRDARVAWQRAFGVRDAESGARVDQDTVFEAASVSKTVFAYAVMQLTDRGTLDLDTPLTRYTPERILEGDPRLDLITARHVLSHTSGLPNFRSGSEPLRIHFTPGERFQYSGEGYWYLQSVVTHLVGTVDRTRCGTYEGDMRQCATDIGAYLAANVLRPCRMASSTYLWNATLERHAARPHDAAGKPLPPARATDIDAGRYAAMGGLRTTPRDYAGFLIEIMAPRTAPPFRLADATRREMVRPQIPVDATRSWALGWEVRRTPGGDLIQHQGGQTGFEAFAAASLERRAGYVILTNSDNGWKIFYDERFVALADRIVLG